jgi:NAD(P)-dependent dehydrogenase (short-subunit alcohol dehydrogenase family)
MPIDADRLCSGKVVVLSGATGAVGGALARRLHAGGARLGIAVRRPWQVAKVTEALGEQGVLVGCVPSADAEAAAGFAKGVIDALGPIDALLCAAGAFSAAPFGKEDSGALRGLLEANFVTPATLARAVVGPMRRRRSGRMVFFGAGAVGGPGGAGMSAYLASKAALHELVRVLSAELRDSGVTAAAVLPGVIDTAANRAAMPEADRSGWQDVDAVVDLALRCALGEPPGPGPLYALGD